MVLQHADTATATDLYCSPYGWFTVFRNERNVTQRLNDLRSFYRAIHYIVHIAVLQLHVVRPSVCLSVCDVGGSGPQVGNLGN